MEFTLAQNSWFGGEAAKITLPDDWDVTWCGIEADSAPVLTRAELKAVIDSPTGSGTISELARGKKEVAIVFDDMSRGTPCADIAEMIVDELLASGIDRRHIRFICALGSHGSCDRTFFEKKLGPRIVREFAIFNHNAFQNTTYVGTTKGGVELYINSELMACDLKIGIGSISPHPVNGFGGAKIVAIGCGDIRTISQLHDACRRGMVEEGLSFVECTGNLAHSAMRREIEEAGRLIGLDFKVDAVLNSNCGIVALTAGDPVEEYYKGVEYAIRYNFAAKKPENMDVVIVNANVKANEAGLAIGLGGFLLRPNGTIVIVDFIRSGQVLHQYSGPSGWFTGGPGYRGRNPMNGVERVILYTPNPDFSSVINFGDPDKIEMVCSWEEVLRLLGKYGAGTRSAVVADGTITAYPVGQKNG